MILLQSILLLGDHPIWYYNAFFYLFVILSILTMIAAYIVVKLMTKKNNEMKLMQQQYVAKIDNIRKEQTETLERLRIEMLKREEERTRQWMESEKETLHVLNGVSNLLDLSEKLDKSESEKIIKKLDEIYDKVSKIPTV